jgi:hypothetical protein
MTVLAYSRPFWPLFLHVFGAMTLFGGILAATVLALARKRSATFVALLVSAPAWVVMRAGAQWIYSDEGKWPNDPTWVTLGFNAADGGLLLLVVLLALSFWWRRSGAARLGRIVAALCSIYLLLLAVAWLAMSGKWS